MATLEQCVRRFFVKKSDYPLSQPFFVVFKIVERTFLQKSFYFFGPSQLHHKLKHTGRNAITSIQANHQLMQIFAADKVHKDAFLIFRGNALKHLFAIHNIRILDL